MTEDGRDHWGRLRRKDAENLLKAHKVAFLHGTSIENLIKLAQAHSINPYDGIEWETVQVPMENGSFRIEKYPKRKSHYTDGKGIDYDSEIEKRTKQLDDENQSLKSRIDELEKMLQKIAGPKSPYESMGYFELKRLAKERGVDIKRTDKKPDIIEKLNGQDAA